MKIQHKFPFLVTACTLALATVIFSRAAEAQGAEANAQDKIEQKRDRGKEVQQYVYPLLKNPSFVDLDWNQPVSWQADKFGDVHLPDEKPEHPDGVFWMREMSATIWKQTPLDFSVYGESSFRVIAPGREFVSGDKCKENALALLKNVYLWFFQQGALPTPKIKEPDRNGIWSFEWQRYSADELPDTRIHAQVRAIDGKVVGFGSSKLVGAWEHKITPTQAKQKALQLASKNPALADVEIDGWSINGGGGITYYEIGLKARNRKTGQMLYSEMTVTAMTGEVGTGMHGWQPAEKDRHPLSVVNDQLPVWTNHGLAFVSNRKLAGMPAWAVVPSQLFLQDKMGNLLSLTSDLRESASFSTVSSLPGSSWVGIEWHGWTYALNLQDGSYRVLGHPERSGVLPTINSTGKWAVISGTGHSGNPDLDLMADNLERDTKLGLRGRSVLPVGDEHHPIFSPDDKWLYFVTTKEVKGKSTHALRRIAAATVLTKDLKQLDEKQIETIIPELPSEVERLSIFSNGEKLLLQTDKGIFAVEVAGKKLTAVTPKDLKDAELGSVPVQEIEDGWAGPTDDRVTFSGKTTDKNGKVRRRIYSCRFDGSDLKAHTPKDNTPVTMYKFPGSDKTAYDVAKEWALGEIKFDDERKANR